MVSTVVDAPSTITNPYSHLLKSIRIDNIDYSYYDIAAIGGDNNLQYGM
jgi:hypothetical protein